MITKTYSYLTDDNDKNQERTQKNVPQNGNWSLKFDDYKNCLEANQLERNNLQKKFDSDSVRRNHKKIMKNNRLKLKLQWKFRNKKPNVFTEELDKTTLIVKMIKQ